MSNLTAGIAGLIILAYAVWIKDGRARGLAAAFGSLLMLIYSVSVNDPIFIILQLVFIASSLVEAFKMMKKK